jgi:arylsulfatase A-like enzyme
VPHANAWSRPVQRTSSLISLGATLGLIYGYLEAAEVLILGAVPGVLAWRNGNSAHILWFAPLFYAAVGFLLAIAFAAIGAVARRAMDIPMVFVYTVCGAFLGASIAEGVLSSWAIAILSLGIGVFITRRYRAHAPVLDRIRTRTTLVLAAGIPVGAILVIGGTRLRERAALAALPAVAGDAPNVLFLVLDTQRADHLSAYGYSRQTSPNLDTLAASAVLFENAFSPSSWTLPSHASYFTGRLPQEHRAGIVRRSYLDRRFPTVAEAFQAAGYATGGFVSNGYWCGRQTGVNRGFIRYEDFYGSLGDALARTSLGRRAAYHWLPLFGVVDIPGRKRADRVNRDFLEWADGLEGRPFMAFLNYLDVHTPLLPPAPFEGRYAGRPVRRGRTLEIGALTGDMPVLPAAGIREMIDRYDESLLFLDSQIGQLMQALRERGILDRTIVVVSSDHGESFGEHGMMYHGHSMFRDQIQVPLIIRFPPRLDAGVRVSQPVGVERVAATMLELAGVSHEGFPGETLPLADSASSPSPAIGGVGRRSMTAANWPSARGWVTSIVTGSHHILLNEDGSFRVYALSDHGEEHDVSAAPGVADSVSAWRQRYGDLWANPERQR